MKTKDGYEIICNSYFGDYKKDAENIVLNITITFLDGTKRSEKRFSKSNKNGIAKTSVYSIKIKVNLNTLDVTELL